MAKAFYSKGASAERQLMKMFAEKGFSVARTAGSGKSSYAPADIIAIKDGKGFAIECKWHNKNALFLDKEKLLKQKEWAENAGLLFFVAWKISYKGFVFLSLDFFKEKDNYFSISKENALEKGINFEDLLKLV